MTTAYPPIVGDAGYHDPLAVTPQVRNKLSVRNKW